MTAFSNLGSFVTAFTLHTRSTHCHASLSVTACKLAFAGMKGAHLVLHQTGLKCFSGMQMKLGAPQSRRYFAFHGGTWH